MDIISLIIIIAIIKKILGSEKEKEQNKRKQSGTGSGEQWKQMVFDFVDKAESYTVKRSEDLPLGGTRTSSAKRGMDAYHQVQQQRATKERLQKKYGTTTSSAYSRTTVSPYASQAAKTDILSRAKENVKEEAQDGFKQESHAAVCSEYRSHAETKPDMAAHMSHSPECDFDAESDILKRVNDLIVMGYDGNMEFDRDFIAEGVEMLNSFSM